MTTIKFPFLLFDQCVGARRQSEFIPPARMTVAYVINTMRPDLDGPVAEALVERLYDIVGR